MGKFCGKIGYAVTKEIKPDVWVETIEERVHYGDWLSNSVKFQNTDLINSDLTIGNDLSIVADPFLKQNFHSIRYVSYMGTKWRVTSVKEAYPRLTLVLGGVYNDENGSQST